MVEIVGHSQTKGRDNREPKLQPKPARQSSTLPTWRGLETWCGSGPPGHNGAPALDPTDERDVETERWCNH